MLPLIGALLIGITLGLLGSGGSILTVPVLVYLLGHADKVAIAESLAIVGMIALFGIIPYARSRQIDWRSVLFFGVPGMIGTYGGAWLANFVPGAAQLVLFGLVMLLAAGLMLRNSQRRLPELSGGVPVDTSVGDNAHEPDPHDQRPDLHRHPIWQIVLEGSGVGVLTGLVGVGGGFLIVPALVILGGLTIRIAVGTSLAVIALKSLAGFYKYVGVLADLELHVDWGTIGLFIAIGTVGSLVGKAISSRMDQLTLRRVFAVFLVVMGLFVLGKEGPRLMSQQKPPTAIAVDAHNTSLAQMRQE
jgi:uncharacterized protein